MLPRPCPTCRDDVDALLLHYYCEAARALEAGGMRGGQRLLFQVGALNHSTQHTAHSRAPHTPTHTHNSFLFLGVRVEGCCPVGEL